MSMVSKELLEEKTAVLRRDWTSDENYYNVAEQHTADYWREASPFRQMFDGLDRSVIVELACGRGRHCSQMKDWPNRKILVDLVPENIEHCRRRFAGCEGITYVVGNGVDLRDIADGAATALFSYDSMVHFHHTIVGAYLTEAARVLKPGGRALLHHSNFAGNPGGDYKANPHWRSFMPPGLFVDYALTNGFKIVEQRLLNWGDVIGLDMLSLIEKAAP
jgi:SAM-dependent methyltransferase